jgi:hypothetical protein
MIAIPFSIHTIIWAVVIILAVVWFVGLIRRGGKSFIHILLLIAILLVLYNFFFR